MRLAFRSFTCTTLLLAAALLTLATTSGAVTITKRSGNAPAGNPDPQINMNAWPGGCGTGFPAPFTAADFAAADGGPPAIVESFIHPAWGQTLPCDPAAQWIGTNPVAAPQSVLFSQAFTLPDNCCFTKVVLNFCWMSDDITGDPVNPAGVYINGQPTPISGGNYAAPTSMSADVTALVHCGVNHLYVYNRDLACAVSGANWTWTLDAGECVTPTHGSSWGTVKALYR